MTKMRITSNTGYMDDVKGLVPLPAGTVLEVEDPDRAKRWVRHGIAEETDLPVGLVTDQEAGMSARDIDAEIARLQELKAARAHPRDGALDQPRPGAVPADDEHPLARYGLNEAQRTALHRAGFTRPDLIDAAGDDEILAVDGIGEGALAKLRGKKG